MRTAGGGASCWFQQRAQRGGLQETDRKEEEDREM